VANAERTQSLEAAIAATESFAQLLVGEGLHGWAERFSAIARLLREGEIHAAKVSYENCRYTGPGSLNDVYAEDQRAFDRAWSLCANSIRALPES
jgi:hypothetical protein